MRFIFSFFLFLTLLASAPTARATSCDSPLGGCFCSGYLRTVTAGTVVGFTDVDGATLPMVRVDAVSTLDDAPIAIGDTQPLFDTSRSYETGEAVVAVYIRDRLEQRADIVDGKTQCEDDDHDQAGPPIPVESALDLLLQDQETCFIRLEKEHGYPAAEPCDSGPCSLGAPPTGGRGSAPFVFLVALVLLRGARRLRLPSRRQCDLEGVPSPVSVEHP